MKRFAAFLMCLVLVCGGMVQTAYAAPAWPDNISISAEGGIVMDAGSGAVLYGKNIHTPYYPASITKILTALIVLENCSLDDVVTFSDNAVHNVEADSSSAGMETGDRLTVRDCLYAMLLKSANEVANALAEHTAGSIAAFADMMNARAASLGCKDSHFNNPSGLNDPEHYTSAYDMALIAQAAFQNEYFVAIDSTLYYDLPPTKRNPDGLRIYPGHKMLKKNAAEYYPGIIGGKTGYTSLAGNTLVTCAERDGMKLIAVVLNGHMTHYVDTKALLDFGFSNFRSLDAADQDTTYASVANDMTIAGLPTADLSILHIQDNCRVTLPVSAAFSDATASISYELSDGAPEHAIARITYSYDGRQIGATYLIHNEAGAAATQPAVEVTTEEYGEAEAEAAPAAAGVGGDAGPNGSAAAGGSTATTGEANMAAGSARSNTAAGSGAADTGNGTAAAADGTSRPEDSATIAGLTPADSILPRIHIPKAVWVVLGVIAALAAGTGGLILLKMHVEKKEDAERTTRYQKRQQRLQDLGVSNVEFDMLLQQKRSRPAGRKNGGRRRMRRHKGR